ncbi:MAG: biotin transporter BioY [Synergistaceae bacterium]|jgi:biotin transport system substrate-specific component|nr:biotin transporter BioY [Synergistaceae bacterium]
MFKFFLLSAFFAVLTAVGGILSIPMPLIPFTMQFFFVLMSGLLLGPKYGPLSQILYITMGLIGLPVFAGGMGGLQRIFSPSFGFLLGFIAASWLTGLLCFGGFFGELPKAKTFFQYSLVCLAATALMYVVALPCFYLNMNYLTNTPVSLEKTFQIAFLPFVVPDTIKAVAAGALAYRTIPLLREGGMLPK